MINGYTNHILTNVVKIPLNNDLIRKISSYNQIEIRDNKEFKNFINCLKKYRFIKKNKNQKKNKRIYNFTNFIIHYLKDWDTTNVTDMSCLFDENCNRKIPYIYNIYYWNIENVKNLNNEIMKKDYKKHKQCLINLKKWYERYNIKSEFTCISKNDFLLNRVIYH